MDTKNNSDRENTFPINFQPMPKRFMVWDKKKREIVRSIGLFDLYFRACLRYDTTGQVYFADNADFIIFQSTNLFDKDGKEIFEGHLVRWNEDVGIVEQYNGKWTFHVVTPAFAVHHELGPNSDMVKVIGHILSNPELLEDK